MGNYGNVIMKAFDRKIISDVDLIFCGHTPIDQPFRFSNFINLDTGCGHQSSKWLAQPGLTIVELSEVLKFHRF